MTVRRRGGPRLRARRGAVLVLTTAMLAVLMMFGAFATDLSHLYTLRNELQTTADASAMAAALQLNQDPSRAPTAADAYVAANAPGEGRATVRAVQFGMWDPVTKGFTPVNSPLSGDAVRVTVERNARWMFGGIFGLLQPEVTATSTAWAAAPVAVARCGKPWAVPYASVMRALGKGDDDPLTGDDLRTLRDTTGGNKRYLTIHAASSKDSPLPGNYYSIVLPPVNDSNRGGHFGGRAYEENIASCTELRVGDTTVTEPGKKVGPTVKGAEAMCHPLASDGTCYNENGGVGVPVAVPVWRPANVNQGGGRTQVVASFIATIVVTHVGHGAEVTGYLYAMNEMGPIIPGDDRQSTVVRAILVR